ERKLERGKQYGQYGIDRQCTAERGWHGDDDAGQRDECAVRLFECAGDHQAVQRPYSACRAVESHGNDSEQYGALADLDSQGLQCERLSGLPVDQCNRTVHAVEPGCNESDTGIVCGYGPGTEYDLLLLC